MGCGALRERYRVFRLCVLTGITATHRAYHVADSQPAMSGGVVTAEALYPDLRGRTVLISGGAIGIGAVLVAAFS